MSTFFFATFFSILGAFAQDHAPPAEPTPAAPVVDADTDAVIDCIGRTALTGFTWVWTDEGCRLQNDTTGVVLELGKGAPPAAEAAATTAPPPPAPDPPPAETADKDGDGWTVTDGDCNDSDATVNPDSTEVCGDGIDQDCSGNDDNWDGTCTGNITIPYDPKNNCSEEGFSKPQYMGPPRPAKMDGPGKWIVTPGYSPESMSFAQCPSAKQIVLAKTRGQHAVEQLLAAGWDKNQLVVTNPFGGWAGVRLEWRPDPPPPLPAPPGRDGSPGLQGPSGSPGPRGQDALQSTWIGGGLGASAGAEPRIDGDVVAGVGFRLSTSTSLDAEGAVGTRLLTTDSPRGSSVELEAGPTFNHLHLGAGYGATGLFLQRKQSGGYGVVSANELAFVRTGWIFRPGDWRVSPFLQAELGLDNGKLGGGAGLRASREF